MNFLGSNSDFDTERLTPSVKLLGDLGVALKEEKKQQKKLKKEKKEKTGLFSKKKKKKSQDKHAEYDEKKQDSPVSLASSLSGEKRRNSSDRKTKKVISLKDLKGANNLDEIERDLSSNKSWGHSPSVTQIEADADSDTCSNCSQDSIEKLLKAKAASTSAQNVINLANLKKNGPKLSSSPKTTNSFSFSAQQQKATQQTVASVSKAAPPSRNYITNSPAFLLTYGTISDDIDVELPRFLPCPTASLPSHFSVCVE